MKTTTTYTERQLNRQYRAWKKATRKETRTGTSGRARQQGNKAFDRMMRAWKQHANDLATTA